MHLRRRLRGRGHRRSCPAPARRARCRPGEEVNRASHPPKRGPRLALHPRPARPGRVNGSRIHPPPTRACLAMAFTLTQVSPQMSPARRCGDPGRLSRNRAPAESARGWDPSLTQKARSGCFCYCREVATKDSEFGRRLTSSCLPSSSRPYAVLRAFRHQACTWSSALSYCQRCTLRDLRGSAR